MKISVNRKDIRFIPSPDRVILRTLHLLNPRNLTEKNRATSLLSRILNLSETETSKTLQQVLREFSMRHRNITRLFTKNFVTLKPLLKELDTDIDTLTADRKLLIGAYFANEYSIESSAILNPSVVESPDQTDLEEGQKRVIVSFRAIGEGHISSIVFRHGIIDENGGIHFPPASTKVEEALIIDLHNYKKKELVSLLEKNKISSNLTSFVLKGFKTNFRFGELQNKIEEGLKSKRFNKDEKEQLAKIGWFADLNYAISFSLDTEISERVIFPVSIIESKGIEDARFVRFQNDDGTITYYATYTAYDGSDITAGLMQTDDFLKFNTSPLHGKSVVNKDLALFPRKIKGKYALISRIDGENNYISFSEIINIWENPIKLQEPLYSWELVQIGNCGPPIETDQGWLIITHGVGPLRKYCLGACLLDLNDPTKELGRMTEPILAPNIEEREGYVPNVVYSCGSIAFNDILFIPYAMSDYTSSFITISIKNLLSHIVRA